MFYEFTTFFSIVQSFFYFHTIHSLLKRKKNQPKKEKNKNQKQAPRPPNPEGLPVTTQAKKERPKTKQEKNHHPFIFITCQ